MCVIACCRYSTGKVSHCQKSSHCITWLLHAADHDQICGQRLSIQVAVNQSGYLHLLQGREPAPDRARLRQMPERLAYCLNDVPRKTILEPLRQQHSQIFIGVMRVVQDQGMTGEHFNGEVRMDG